MPTAYDLQRAEDAFETLGGEVTRLATEVAGATAGVIEGGALGLSVELFADEVVGVAQALAGVWQEAAATCRWRVAEIARLQAEHEAYERELRLWEEQVAGWTRAPSGPEAFDGSLLTSAAPPPPSPPPPPPAWAELR